MLASRSAARRSFMAAMMGKSNDGRSTSDAALLLLQGI
jgi:hypothetical protein